MKRVRIAVLSSLLVCGFNVAKAEESIRKEINLNGIWDFSASEWEKRDDFPAADAEWKTIEVPSYWDGLSKADVGWYKKTIDIPKEWVTKDKEIVIYCERASYWCFVYVNKKYAGEHFGGMTSFEINITPHIKAGNNELLLKVYNTLVSAYKPPRDAKVREAKTPSKLIAPVHHRVESQNGLGGDVILTCRSKVFVDDVFIKTSVQSKNLEVDITIKNDTPKAVEVDIVNIVKDTKVALGQKNVGLEPNSTRLVRLSAIWKNPNLWSFESPHLYYLETTILRKGTIIDRKTARFGFREFRVEENHFTLNGKKVHLFSENWCMYGYNPKAHTIENFEERIKHVKSINLKCIRAHMQAAPPRMLNVADEMGLMIIAETVIGMCAFPPFWNWEAENEKDLPLESVYYEEENVEYWKNAEPQIKEWIKRDKNHPCVVMWSVENEYFGDAERPRLKDALRMKQMGDWAKEIDPTRPIMYASDGDMFGFGDVYDFHYPHEYSCYNLTHLPHHYYKFWEDNFLKGYLYRNWQDEPLDLTQKPVCITEEHFLGSPGPSQSVLIGGLAHKGGKEPNRAHAAIAKMCIEADRYYDIALPGEYDVSAKYSNLGSPFIKEVFKPICVIVKDYNKTFYASSQVKRTLTIYNDSLQTAKLKLKLQTEMRDKAVQSEEIRCTINPGYFHRQTVTLEMPKVDTREKLNFTLTLYKGTELIDKKEKVYYVFPQKVQPGELDKHKTHVFDVALKNTTIYKLKSMGFDFKILNYDLQHQRWLRSAKRYKNKCRWKRIPPDVELIIIGKDALEEFRRLYFPEVVKEFLINGGKILCLDQNDVIVEDWFEDPVKLISGKTNFDNYRDYNFVFPVDKNHPMFKNLILDPSDDPIENAFNGDLSLWGEDGVVSRSCFEKPEGEAFACLLEVGGWFYGSPALLEVKSGKGRCIFSQLDIIGKIDSEPLAKQMLINLIGYLTK